jgi:hypothetical protein
VSDYLSLPKTECISVLFNCAGELLSGKWKEPDERKQPENETYHCSSIGGQKLSIWTKMNYMVKMEIDFSL